MSQSRHRWHRRPIVQTSLLAALLFGIYAAGACRTIYVGDSGELVTAAATLGIPHPSGYPLFVLLGKAWITFLGVGSAVTSAAGSVAFHMSLFSAFFAALACGLLFLTCRRQQLATIPSLTAALLLAFGPSFWSQANVQRVYSLNAFCLIAMLALTMQWYRSRRLRWLALAALCAGLGAANHLVMGVLGLAVGVFAIGVEPALLKRPLHLLACIGAGIIGLLPYAYLPWRSRQDPRLDWGDPETLDSFLNVVLRRDFWHRAWIETPGDALAIFGNYLHSLGHETLWVGALLAIVGLARGLHSWRGLPRWPVALPLLIMAANLWAVAAHGSRSDIFIWHRYYIPSYAMLAWLAGYGCQLAAERWGRKAHAVLLVPLMLFILGWPRFDRSDFTLADDFSRTLLATLPPGAHLAAADDNILFALIYLHLVEGVRPDVNLIMQGVGDINLPSLRFDPDHDPLYFTHHPNWHLAGLEVVPVGLVFQTVRAGERPKPMIPKDHLDGAWDPAVPKDYLAQNLAGHYHYMLGLTFEISDWPRAQIEFERAATMAPNNDVTFFNLGLIYRRNGLLRRSLAAFERAARINPKHIPSQSPVRPADRAAKVRSEVERLEALEHELRQQADLRDDGSAAYHRSMAELLRSRGAEREAHGHYLLALEAEAVDSPGTAEPA